MKSAAVVLLALIAAILLWGAESVRSFPGRVLRAGEERRIQRLRERYSYLTEWGRITSASDRSLCAQMGYRLDSSLRLLDSIPAIAREIDIETGGDTSSWYYRCR